MENDQQRPYSRDEVKEEMKKLINDISYTLCLRETEPTVILMHLGWDLIRVIEPLAEKKEELLAELGLKPVVIDSNQDLSGQFCGICSKTEDEFNVSDDDDEDDDRDDRDDDEDDEDDDDNDEGESDGEGEGEGECEVEVEVEVEVEDDEDDDHHFISTPFCSHKFCKTCWREYLEKNFYSLEENLTVISCPDQDCGAAVGKKTIEKLGIHDQEMYESYLLRSYLETKQLHAQDCN